MARSPISRRELMGTLAAAAMASKARPLFAGLPGEAPDPYLSAADGAARWLKAVALETAGGMTWAVDPRDPRSVQTSLYSGSPGVVLFLLEYAAVRDDRGALDLARRGAHHLAAWLQTATDAELSGEGAGLYTGIAGVAFTLEQAARATDDAGLQRAAASAMDTLMRRAIVTDGQATWNDSNDIISGTAGIGLTLLWAARALGTPGAAVMAGQAGRALLARGVKASAGMTWSISPAVPRRYPNFSHGAAGAGYFLASLYAVTGERAFLDGALQAAAYLQSVATTTPGGGRMVFHSEPGNEQLFYLSWCHGPSGTARLFHRLAEVTRDRSWSLWADQLNTATRDMKVPERSPGFWNNVSQCCGNCGVVEHLVAVYDRQGDTRSLDYARRIADDVIARASRDGDGLKWVQAENRTQPEVVVAQTGLMQGAAGVGLAMLHLAGAATKRRPVVVLPDSPYFT